MIGNRKKEERACLILLYVSLMKPNSQKEFCTNSEPKSPRMSGIQTGCFNKSPLLYHHGLRLRESLPMHVRQKMPLGKMSRSCFGESLPLKSVSAPKLDENWTTASDYFKDKHSQIREQMLAIKNMEASWNFDFIFLCLVHSIYIFIFLNESC